MVWQGETWLARRKGSRQGTILLSFLLGFNLMLSLEKKWSDIKGKGATLVFTDKVHGLIQARESFPGIHKLMTVTLVP